MVDDLKTLVLGFLFGIALWFVCVALPAAVLVGTVYCLVEMFR